MHMKTQVLLFIFGLIFATAIAGCAGSQFVAPQNVRPTVDRSASNDDLVYVDSEFHITVATYPALKPTKRFTLEGPKRLCSDASGNVFVTTTASVPAYVYEYRHGETSAFAKLTVPQPFDAAGCSVDPRTNDLAVGLSETGYQVGGGGIAIYKDESGTPHAYADSGLSEVKDVAYDDSGDVFAIGIPPQHSGYGGEPVLEKLAKGSAKFTAITGIPSYDLTYIDGIQWDGTHLDIQYGLSIAQLAVSGSAGNVASWIRFNPPSAHVGRVGTLWLDLVHSQVLFPLSHRGELAVFPYPQGGNAIEVKPYVHGKLSSSVTISAAP